MLTHTQEKSNKGGKREGCRSEGCRRESEERGIVQFLEKRITVNRTPTYLLYPSFYKGRS